MTTNVQEHTNTFEGPTWRIHRDYPFELPFIVQDIDNSVQTLSDSPKNIEIELPLEITKVIIKTLNENRGIQELSKLYVESIRKISEVEKVFLIQSNDYHRILTIIKAPPFDSSIRKQIYESEQNVLQLISEPIVTFRLINSSEIDDEISKIIPLDAVPIYLK